MQNPNLFNLPHDTLGEILSHLDIKSIISLINCSKSAKALFTAPNTCIWETFMNLKGLGEELKEISNTVNFIITHFVTSVMKLPTITLDHHLRYLPYDKEATKNTVHEIVSVISRFISENRQEICAKPLSEGIKFVKNKIPNFLYEYIRDFYFNYLLIMNYGSPNDKSEIIYAEDDLYIVYKSYLSPIKKKQNKELENKPSKYNKMNLKSPNFYEQNADYYVERNVPIYINSICDLSEYFEIKENLHKNPTPKNRKNALRTNVRFMEYIYDPTDSEIEMHLEQYPTIIGYSLNPSENLQLKSLKIMKSKKHRIPMLRFIRNPTLKVIHKAIKYDEQNRCYVSDRVLFDVYVYRKSTYIFEYLLKLEENNPVLQRLRRYIEDNYDEQIIESLPLWPNLIKRILKNNPKNIRKISNYFITKEIFDEFTVDPKNVALLLSDGGYNNVIYENITSEQAMQAVMENYDILTHIDSRFEFLNKMGLTVGEWILKAINIILECNSDVSFLTFIDLDCVSLDSLLVGKICLKNSQNSNEYLEDTNDIMNEILQNTCFYEWIEAKISSEFGYHARLFERKNSQLEENVKLSNFIIEMRKKVIDNYPHLLPYVISNSFYPVGFDGSKDMLDIINKAVEKFPPIAVVLEKIPNDLEILYTVSSENLIEHKTMNKDARLLGSLLYNGINNDMLSKKFTNINENLNKKQIKTMMLLNPWLCLDSNKHASPVESIKVKNKILKNISTKEELEKTTKYLNHNDLMNTIKVCGTYSIDLHWTKKLTPQEFQKLSSEEKVKRLNFIEKITRKHQKKLNKF